MPVDVLRAVVREVHAAGGRVAVHSQHPEGGAAENAKRMEGGAAAVAGVRPHDALAAASWSAREYLGLRGLEPGAPADAVVCHRDPREDLGQLAEPVAVVLRGRCVRRRG